MTDDGRNNVKGLIIRSLGGFYDVRTPQGDYQCRGRGIFRRQDTQLVVGDRVEVEPTQPGEGCIVALEERRNSLIRPPVANIDRLALVISGTQPAPNLLIIDQLTAIAARRGIPVVMIFTKIDLEDVSPYTRIYRQAGFPVYEVDSLTGAGAREVGELLAQGVTAFCGNSGAGKSSLLNALYPGLALATGAISQKLGRGRHTTRHVELFPTGRGGYIADTPGFSAIEFLQFEKMMAGELADCFLEFREYQDRCRYTGCSHTVEQGCAVLAAVEAGQIPPSRHQSYCAVYRQLKDIREWELK